jgi:hypothetical protein
MWCLSGSARRKPDAVEGTNKNGPGSRTLRDRR